MTTAGFIVGVVVVAIAAAVAALFILAGQYMREFDNKRRDQ